MSTYNSYTVNVPNYSDLIVKHGASCFWMTTRAFPRDTRARLRPVTYCPTRESVLVWDEDQQRWQRDHVVPSRTRSRIKTKWFREVNKEWIGRMVDIGKGDDGRVVDVSSHGVEVAWESGVRTLERYDRVLDGWLPLPGKEVG